MLGRALGAPVRRSMAAKLPFSTGACAAAAAASSALVCLAARRSAGNPALRRGFHGTAAAAVKVGDAIPSIALDHGFQDMVKVNLAERCADKLARHPEGLSPSEHQRVVQNLTDEDLPPHVRAKSGSRGGDAEQGDGGLCKLAKDYVFGGLRRARLVPEQQAVDLELVPARARRLRHQQLERAAPRAADEPQPHLGGLPQRDPS